MRYDILIEDTVQLVAMALFVQYPMICAVQMDYIRSLGAESGIGSYLEPWFKDI